MPKLWRPRQLLMIQVLPPPVLDPLLSAPSQLTIQSSCTHGHSDADCSMGRKFLEICRCSVTDLTLWRFNQDSSGKSEGSAKLPSKVASHPWWTSLTHHMFAVHRSIYSRPRPTCIAQISIPFPFIGTLDPVVGYGVQQYNCYDPFDVLSAPPWSWINFNFGTRD